MPVVDASVAIDWVAPGVDPSLPSIAVLDRPADQGDDQGDDLIAPRLFAEEVANALLTGIRRGRWSGTAADEGYDMLYVALAERRRTQLITADEALRRRLWGLDWIVSPEAFVAGRR
jgi:predicted nucleic acid-binding protein